MARSPLLAKAAVPPPEDTRSAPGAEHRGGSDLSVRGENDATAAAVALSGGRIGPAPVADVARHSSIERCEDINDGQTIVEAQ